MRQHEPIMTAGTKTSNTAWLLLMLIVLLGTHLRVQMVAHTEVIDPVRSDARDYVLYALNLERFGVYSGSGASLGTGSTPSPDAVRPPGYPAFLYAVFSATSDEFRIRGALWAQTMLSVLAIPLSFLLFQRFLPPFFSLTATLLVAISPHLVAVNIYLLTETLYCAFLLLLFFLASRFFHKPDTGSALLIGLTSGLATLVRPALQFFIVPLAILVGTRASGRRALVWGIAALLAHATVVGAWTARNLSAIGRTSDPTLQINFLHHGLYPDFMYNGDPRSYGYPYRFDPNSPLIRKSSEAALAEIKRRFSEDPADYARWYLIGKPLAFWSWNYVQGMGDVFIYEVGRSPYSSDRLFRATHRLMRSVHWPLIALGALGALVPWLPRRWRGEVEMSGLYTLRAVSLLLIYYTLLHMVGAPFPRYATPLRPFLFGIATFAVYWSWRRLIPGGAHHGHAAATE